jgi:hypothetical protein
VKVGNNYELLEGDEHKSFMKKRKREDQEARPDIVHQVLLPVAVRVRYEPWQLTGDARAVPADAPGQPAEQGRQAAGLHSHFHQRPH